MLFRILAVLLALAALTVSPGTAMREVTRQDVRLLKNAWFVFPVYGSVQLKNGNYVSPSHRIHIAVVSGTRFVPIEGSRIAALSTVRVPGEPTQLFLSLFTRDEAGYFRNDATVRVGRGVRPLSLTMHASRIRVSIIRSSGRETTLIYHVTSHGLQEAATRHA